MTVHNCNKDELSLFNPCPWLPVCFWCPVPGRWVWAETGPGELWGGPRGLGLGPGWGSPAAPQSLEASSPAPRACRRATPIQEEKGPHVTVYRPDVKCDELSFLKWMNVLPGECLARSSSPVSSPSRPPCLPLTFTQHLATPWETTGRAFQGASEPRNPLPTGRVWGPAVTSGCLVQTQSLRKQCRAPLAAVGVEPCRGTRPLRAHLAGLLGLGPPLPSPAPAPPR